MVAKIDQGSFRDPRGHVYVESNRVFRTITRSGVDDFRFVQETGLLDKLVDEQKLVPFTVLDKNVFRPVGSNAEMLLEHPRLPFISYPYEWGFKLLKSAALAQLDIYIEALEHGVTLTDASAYNIQFVGSRPIFIDHLAFRRYKEGEFWSAHRQYCEQFLNPLLLRAKLGIAHNSWYRGSLEGISTADLNALLPLRKKLSWNMFTQVLLQDKFQKASLNKTARAAVSIDRGLPRKSFQNMLFGLRRWIEKLVPLNADETVWGDYANDNSYSDDGADQKRRFVAEFAAEVKPELLWDIGCNSGDYSCAALESGAGSAIGFDFDQAAIDTGYERATKEGLSFLPLFLDAANPAPNQGWGESERKGLGERAGCDALLALALVHHLAIGKNIPLKSVVDWLISLAPHGVVEFVPKNDPMVKELLRFRDDIFDDYDLEHFCEYVSASAAITKSEQVAGSDRRLIWYSRRV